MTKNAVYICKFGHACEMDMYMRRKCQECRLKKCLAVGMRPECVVPETQCAQKRKEKKAQREKDKLPVSTTTVDDHMPPIMQCDPPPPEAARIVSYRNVSNSIIKTLINPFLSPIYLRLF